MSTGGGQLLGISVLELRTDQRALNTGLASARTKVDAAGAEMQRSLDRRMTSLGGSMSRAGGAMSRNLTAPLLALGGATALAAAHFSSAMEMIHTQAGASQREVDKLTGSVLALARSGQVSQGPQQLAEGLFHLESIGLRGARAMDALKIAAQGAAVGGANLEDTATALGSAWLVNIKGAGSLHDVMGLLNATVGAGNVRMGDLVQALGVGLLPAAKVAGLSIQDVFGAMAVFTDEGYQASSAAAQFATSLHFLYAPTAKAGKALESIGLNTDQLALDMHKPQGLLVALRDLHNHLSGLSQVKQEQVLGAILPAGRGRILITLLNQLDRYDMKLKQIQRTSGQFDEAVKKTQEQPLYKIHQAWATIQADAIDFGKKVLPELLSVGKDIVHDVDKVATAFTKLPKGAQDAIITGGLLVAGIGPAMKVLGLFTSGIGKLMTLGKMLPGLFGLGKVAGDVGKLNSTVGTMEVGTLIAKSMIGGGGGGGGWNPKSGSSTLSTAEKDAAGGAGAGAGASGLKGWLKWLKGGGAESTAAEDVAGGAAISMGQAVAAFATGVGVFYVSEKGIGAFRDLVTGGAPGTTGFAETNLKAFQFRQTNKFGGGDVLPTPLHLGVTQATPRGGNNVFDTIAGALHGKAFDAKQEIRDFATANAELSKLANHQQGLKATAFNLDYLAQQAKKVGDVKMNFADRLGAELLRSRNVESKGVKQIIGEMDKLAPGARVAASQSMIFMTRQLEQDGRLPKGATTKLIDDLLTDYKGLRDKGGKYFEGLLTDATQQLTLLRQRAAHESGQAKQQTLAQISALQKGMAHAFGQMLGNVTTQTGKMKSAVSSNSHQAFQIGSANFGQLASNIAKYIGSGAEATKQGLDNITAQINAVLKSYGEAPLNAPVVKSLSSAQLAAVVSGQVSSGAAASPHERGGFVGRPGERGTDTVRALLGRGEAVLKHQDQALVNAGLAVAARSGFPVGSLDGVFSATSGQKHWMAGGGYAGYDTGGYVYPVPGLPVKRTDQGKDFGGAGSVGAIGDARILTTSEWPGWPGDGGIVYRLLSGPRAGMNVYTEEGFHPSVPAGALVKAGQVIGQAWGGPTGIEMGWANSSATGPLTPYNGAPDGTPMPGGIDFAAFVAGLARGILTGGGGIGGTVRPIPTLQTPGVHGGGVIGTIAHAALKKVTDAANKYLQSHLATAAAGTGGAIGSSGIPSKPGFTITGPVSWFNDTSTAFGKNANTDPGISLRIPGTDFGDSRNVGLMGHTFRVNIGGHTANLMDIDLGPNQSTGRSIDVDLPALPLMGFNASNFPTDAIGTATLLYALGGFAGLPRAARGRVGSGGGGLSGSGPVLDSKTGRPIPPEFLKHKMHGKKPKHPKYRSGGAGLPTPGQLHAAAHPPVILGKDGPLPFHADDIETIQGLLRHIGGLAGADGSGGDVALTGQKLDYHTALWGQDPAPNYDSLADPSAFVVTQDAQGNQIAPYIDTAALLRVLGQGEQVLGYDNRMVSDVQTSLHAARKLIPRIHKAIVRRRKMIERIRKRIQANLAKIKRLRKSIAAEHKQKKPDKAKLKAWGEQITDLQQENMTLAGSKTSIGQSGELKQLQDQVTNLTGAVNGGNSSSALVDLLSGPNLGGLNALISNITSPDGALAQDNLAVLTQTNAITLLAKGVPGSLATAQASFQPSSASSGVDSQLASLDGQIIQQLGDQLAVSQAQYGVLSHLGDLPPFGGSFGAGGVVPGALGEARTIIAHGGELVSQPGSAGRNPIYLVVEDGAVNADRIKVIADGRVQKLTRRVARHAGRGLPGAGGGMLANL